VPLLCTVPGITWVLAYTIAAELGDIDRFPSPRKLAATAVSARASTNRASATCAVRSPSRVPATCAGSHGWGLPRPR
jgi:transposase